MDQKAQDIIIQMLKEGHRASEIKTRLLGLGYSLDNFYDYYHRFIDELGIEETTLSSTAKDFADSYRVTKNRPASPTWQWLVVLVKATLVIGGLAFLSWLLITGSWRSLLSAVLPDNANIRLDEGMTARDLSHEAALQSIPTTARLYKNKLLDYGGLCRSIGLDPEYRCIENKQAYAIEARLSTGQFYCIDSTGFKGVVRRSFWDQPLCPK